MGIDLMDNKIYHFAQKYLLHGTNIEAEIKLLREWRNVGKEEEFDLIMMRYILM